MNYIHGRDILLHTIIGMGIVFSLTANSIIYCAPGRYDKPKNTTKEHRNKERLNSMNKSLKKIDKSINGMVNCRAAQGKLTSKTEIDKLLANLNGTPYAKISEHLGNVIESLQDTGPKNTDNKNDIRGQVVNGDNTPPQPVSMYDVVPKPRPVPEAHPQTTPIRMENVNTDNENNIRMQVANGDNAPPQPVSMYDVVPKPRPVPEAHPQTTPIRMENVNTDNIPQNTLNENMYTSTNNSNLHSSQVKSRNKRSIPYDSENDNLNRDNRDEHHSNKDDYGVVDDYIDDDLSGNNINTHYFGYTNQYDSEDTVDGSAKLNDSSNKDDLYQDDDSMYAEIIYAEIPSYNSEDTVDAPAKLNDSNDEYNSQAAQYNSEGTVHVQLRVDDKYLSRIYYDESDKYEKMDAQYNSEDAVDVPAKLNDSNNEHRSNQDDEHIYAEIPLHNREDAVDVPAKLNDSNNEHRSNQDDEHIYAEIPLHNREDAVDVPAKLNDSDDEHRSNQDDEHIYAEIPLHNREDAVDVPAKLNDSDDEHRSNQDDDKKKRDPDAPNGNTPLPDTPDAPNGNTPLPDTPDAPNGNTPPPDPNDTTTSAINADNNSTDHNDDKEWDDDAPDNNIIADENNQLSNTYNQKKAIAHGDHGIFSHLFNSANYTALHRISSRLTADALEQTMAGQFISQKLVSSGSNISNVQHEIWMMPLIKKGEKYVDNVSKYTISTYGINVGFDSKIPHCRGNIESVLGIVFALYNSQLKHTASDSATFLNTYIISMYYSIIFNQKFFIYTLFSFGTSNAGNYHSTIGVNNNRIYNPEPCSSYNAFRQSVELHAGYNIMVYDSQLHNRQIVLLPMAGVQIDTVALHGDAKQHYSSVQQLKLSTGIKIAHHKRIKPSISINYSLYGFVNYCPWSNPIDNNQSLMSNFENETLVEKENLATSNNKLYYRIGGEASLQYNKVMYSLRYEMNLAQDYLSHQIGLKIKLKF